MKDTIASKTVQVALVFASMGLMLIFADRAIDIASGAGLRYVPEFFIMLTGLFGVIGAKNAGDNFIAYRERTVSAQYGPVPPNAPQQPQV